VSYALFFTRQAKKDAKKLKGSPHAPKAKELLELIRVDPFADPPPFETLIGDLSGALSRRINIQHRLVYQVLEEEKAVKVLRLWSHYE
jgi:toxin YoeB